MLQAPLAGVALAVGSKNIRVVLPVKAAGVGDGAAQGRAMAGNGFGERVDDQRGAHCFGAKQPGRSDGVVHHVHQAVRLAQRTNGWQISNLGAGVGNGFHKHQAGVGLHGSSHVRHGGGVYQRDLNAKVFQSSEQAVGVAKHIATRHHVVTSA